MLKPLKNEEQYKNPLPRNETKMIPLRSSCHLDQLLLLARSLIPLKKIQLSGTEYYPPNY